MHISQKTGATSGSSLRLWPAVAAVVLQWFLWAVLPLVTPGAVGVSVFGALACGAVVLAWWLFFSRAPWLERFAIVALMIAAVPATRLVVHESMAGGMMGLMVAIYAIPVLSLALVAGAVAGRRLATWPRRATIAAAILLGCAAMTLIRTGGLTGEGDSELHWRWTKTPEERLLAQARMEPEPAPAAAVPAAPAAVHTPPSAAAPPEATATRQAAAPSTEETSVPPKAVEASTAGSLASAGGAAAWPGFRGGDRNAVVRGVQIDTDWSRRPPVEVWRRPIGPAWSSFAVSGDLVYTQEQRGDAEVVSCYRLTTGEPVWKHQDATRFWESNGGAGPRATPAVHAGRVYALGATGILNALDARTGALFWSRNGAADTGAKLPGWGFAGSPLVADDSVIVALSGHLAAYELDSGRLRWTRPTGGGGYSSPHLVTIDGVAQIVLLTGGGATSVAPGDGALLWEHAWPSDVAIVQPGVAPDGSLLITVVDAMGGLGIRRLHVAHAGAAWTADELWTTRGLKPYFNDFVVHGGHAFGFDGSILASISLEDGSRAWKGGRYGHGQLILLPAQDLLLVLSEEGELALVRAATGGFSEVARFKAIEGKTWNHPVLVGDLLLVRNGEEMAAFRLAVR